MFKWIQKRIVSRALRDSQKKLENARDHIRSLIESHHKLVSITKADPPDVQQAMADVIEKQRSFIASQIHACQRTMDDVEEFKRYITYTEKSLRKGELK